MIGMPREVPRPRTGFGRNWGGRAIAAIGTSPRTWPRYGSRARRYVFPRYPFSLVYILRGEDIEIVAVAHGRRRPGYWRSRL